MTRDWDKIREILIKLEELPAGNGNLNLSDFDTNKAYEYSYNTELLIEAGLIHGSMSKTFGVQANGFIAIRLTWEGHEFLDAIRSDSVWEKTKASFKNGGLSMTLDLVKTVAKNIAITYLETVTNE